MNNNRILAFVIDYITVALIVIMCASSMVLLKFNSFIEDKFHIDYISFIFWFFIILLIGKDMIEGKSIGKRVMGLEVVKANKPIKKSTLIFIRNITLLIWPIDIVFFILNNQRILDSVFKIEVVSSEKTFYKKALAKHFTAGYLLFFISTISVAIILSYTINQLWHHPLNSSEIF